jgi:CubicO group peptidase (beta-lactamase class C family)
MRWLILAFAAIPCLALWATVVFLATANGWLRAPLAPTGDTSGFVAAVQRTLDHERNGNAAFRLLEGGQVAGEHYVSTGDPVNADTQFQVASLSKWIAAWGVMHLVETRALDLDAPVDQYLVRWHLPESEFDNDEVTIRRLLSHSAGLTDGLGYGGFPPGTPVQDLTDSLTRAEDAMPGADGRVRVGIEPGSEWRYSGGGYALLELLVEDVSGETFEAYLQRTVLAPLGMRRSTYLLSDPPPDNLATFYAVDGTPAPHYLFSASSAAGLYTTAADLTRFLQAQVAGPDGQPAGRGVIAAETLARMREPHAETLGTDIWGLGHMLYAPNGAGGHIIGHEGGNRPAINTSVRLDPASGDGIILLVTGNEDLASRLGGEWVFWRTGRLDVAAYADALGDVVFRVAVGWAVIALGFAIIGWRVTRPASRS